MSTKRKIKGRGNPTVISQEITLGTADNKYVPIPFSSDTTWELLHASTAIDAAITTSDETVQVKNGGTTVAAITITQSSSTAGDVDAVEVTSASRYFSGGDVALVAIGGQNGAATNATLVLTFEQVG